MLGGCGGSEPSEAQVVAEALEELGLAVEECELYHDVQQLYRCQLAEPVDGDTDWCAVFDTDDGEAELVAPYRVAHEDCQ